ncbi:classical arabinogalactan protein 9-like [Bactrocera tryoni]|uniref:classical arabinogalactan protein 9-like n=1 Tax=Bactrocera tryoni TaxID=59916 RepID=UPI001A96ED6A|nr:classical arabinogalactan protein 9-like [Bactrocera tryoni]
MADCPTPNNNSSPWKSPRSSLLPLATRVTTFAAPSFATPTPLPTVLDGWATLPLPLPPSLRDDPVRAAAFTVVATKALPPQHPLPPSTPPTLRGDPARATTFSAEATLALLPQLPLPPSVPPTLRGDPARVTTFSTEATVALPPQLSLPPSLPPSLRGDPKRALLRGGDLTPVAPVVSPSPPDVESSTTVEAADSPLPARAFVLLFRPGGISLPN